MTFEEFWTVLSQSGVTPQGDQYNVTDDGRLHILSVGNQNQFYYFSRQISERYYLHDIPENGETWFRRMRSSYFYNVYAHVIRETA